MVENKDNLKEENKPYDGMIPDPPFWREIKDITKEYLKIYLKKYLLPLLITFLTLLGSIFCLYPIAVFPTDISVLVISIIFSLLVLILGVAPFYLSLNDIICCEFLNLDDEKNLFNAKQVMKAFFKHWYINLRAIFRGATRIFPILFKTFLVYLFLILIVILPSHFVKISAEPEYFQYFNQFLALSKNGNLGITIQSFLTLKSFYSIELLIINLLTYAFFIIHTMFSLQFIMFKHSALIVGLKNKHANYLFRLTVRQNKWSFAAFFVNSFKYLIIVFIILLGVFGYLYSILFTRYIEIFVMTTATTTLSLFISLPFIMGVQFNTFIAFSDMYITSKIYFLNQVIEKTENEKEKRIISLEIEKWNTVSPMLQKDRARLYKEIKRNKKLKQTPTNDVKESSPTTTNESEDKTTTNEENKEQIKKD